MKKVLIWGLLLAMSFSLTVYAVDRHKTQRKMRPQTDEISVSISDIQALGIQQKTYNGLNYGVKFVNENMTGDTRLILLLHGRSGMGDDNLRQLANPAIKSLSDYAKNNGQKIIILAPQCPKGNGWGKINDAGSSINTAIELVKQIMQEYSVLPKNVYVSGNSMGGAVCYSLMSRYPNIFAKAIIISSGGNSQEVRSAKGEFYILHSENDNIISVERAKSMVEALQNNPQTNVKFKILQSNGHMGNAKLAYTNDVWEWMFN